MVLVVGVEWCWMTDAGRKRTYDDWVTSGGGRDDTMVVVMMVMMVMVVADWILT